MRNIVVIGFMGTGKTVVGAALAKRLGCRFVDTDRLIEEREGMSIAEIFRVHGEHHFRACERAVVRETSGLTDCVIAAGGGAVEDPESMDALKRSGILVCLTASPEAILTRVGPDRPLLRVEDRRAEVERLLRVRAPLYAQADLTLDTTGAGVDEAVDRLMEALKEHGQ